MAINYLESFKKKLEEIFMMNHAELDFGIYRIMNQKRQEIRSFLDTKLLPQVKAALASSDDAAARKRMAEIEGQVGGNIEVLPLGTPMRDEYERLKASLATGGNADEMLSLVFSHLVTFFSRYYDGGDFLSKRRYKADTYAIPYNGEEVKLHWANADQYYIKTSEYFRDYTFVLPTSRRKVHFVLKDASTEQNNNRSQNNMERRFALLNPEGDEPIVEITDQGELNIYFTYELMSKSNKQKDLNIAALQGITPLVPADFAELLTVKAPTAANANRTLLEKHITDYTAKNSFDYFIHKDLGGFLSRELDFYIKNEVLFLDDLDPKHITSQLAVVKAIKGVGEKIITMLAQLEDFQRRLWLKKKFVVGCDYCITLDRIDEKFYPEIAANEAQRKEWVRLFAINEIKGDGMFTHSYSEPLTVDFLKENPFLVLDTAFFPADFKHRLLATFDHLDEQTNGLLINSENFQALQLLQEKYSQRVKMVFVDPPYNTEDSEGQNDFNYKDNFQHSSWLSFYLDRLILSYSLLSQKGIHTATISDKELTNMLSCYDIVFNEDNRIGIIEWNSTKSVTNTALISVGHTHIPIYARDIKYYVTHRPEFRLPDSEDGFSNPDNDPRGKWKADPFQVGGERLNQLYEIVNPKTGVVYRPNPGNSWKNEYSVFLKLLEDNRIVFGASGEAGPQRKRFWFEAEERGRVAKTWWDDAETTTNGTKLLKNMFGICPFKNPKPLALMKNLISLCAEDHSIVLDYFGGSATTIHGVIQNNRENDSNISFVACEMGYYFDSTTKPRIIKAIYSADWKDGKPVSRNGISQCFKYIRLEQYEDTLNNLQLKQQGTLPDDDFGESYMLQYMLDVETRDSLLNLQWFVNPFAMTLKTTRDNELVETPVDMVETFNYLIGLDVDTIDWHSDSNICAVTGITHRERLKTLVIWRNCERVDNEALNRFFESMDYRTHDKEFDQIYVNGDNTLPNLRRDEESWKVVLIEEEFLKRMFED